jgi:hypothetical protein
MKGGEAFKVNVLCSSAQLKLPVQAKAAISEQKFRIQNHKKNLTLNAPM